MDVRAVLEICTAVIASLGGGGLIVFGLSGYLGRVWADRALAKQKQEYDHLNIKFNHQLDLVTRRVQIELDAIGHLHKLRTQAEFERVQELWKRIEALRSAFNKASHDVVTIFGTLQPSLIQEFNEQRNKEFAARHKEAITFLRTEALSIPQDIADSARELLESRGCMEQLFNGASNAEAQHPLDSPSYTTFVERRRGLAEEFLHGTLRLEAQMREFLSGDSPNTSQK